MITTSTKGPLQRRERQLKYIPSEILRMILLTHADSATFMRPILFVSRQFYIEAIPVIYRAIQIQEEDGDLFYRKLASLWDTLTNKPTLAALTKKLTVNPVTVNITSMKAMMSILPSLISKFTNLTHLALVTARAFIDPAPLGAVGPLVRLTHLTLKGEWLCSSVKELLLRQPSLTFLSINQYEDEDFKDIPADSLVHLQTYQFMGKFSSTRLCHQRPIEHLSIGDYFFGYSFMTDFPSECVFSHVKTLSVQCQDASSFFSVAGNFPSLELLRIYSDCVIDLDHFHSLTTTSLGYLSVWGIKYTQESTQELFKLFPSLLIIDFPTHPKKSPVTASRFTRSGCCEGVLREYIHSKHSNGEQSWKSWWVPFADLVEIKRKDTVA